VWSDGTAAAQKVSGKADTPFYLSIYFAFGFGSLLIMVMRSAAVVLGTVRAARKLHFDLLQKVLCRPPPGGGTTLFYHLLSARSTSEYGLALEELFPPKSVLGVCAYKSMSTICWM